VPWVDERLTDRDLYGSPSPPPAPRPDSRPCRAERLGARLDKWWRPTGSDGGGSEPPRREPGKLIGYVDVTNTGDRECTLRGETDVRLFSAGHEVPIHYSHGINDEARRRVVVLVPGGHAQLRLDWTGPYCGTERAPFELRIHLPDDGGVLPAPVVPADVPPCSRSDTHPEYASYLSASGFEPPPVVDPERDVISPLQDLTLSLDVPATATLGERMTYHVLLRNPTDHPVSLLPCPGYLQELFSQGDSTAPAVNEAILYRLNCRPVAQIPARGVLRFEMVVAVPAILTAGRELHVSWQFRTRQKLAGKPELAGHAVIRIR
jgi:hypothetical protein